MLATLTTSKAPRLRSEGGASFVLGWFAALLALGVVAWAMSTAAGWVAMWVLAASEFALLKLATLRGAPTKRTWRRTLGYLVLWPGMDARAFFTPAREGGGDASGRELCAALAKLGLGLALMGWAARHAFDAAEGVVAWVGMLGIIFALHFGGLHVVSWAWRRAGVDAPPIMRAPIAATSLVELWGGRWNRAFADAARRLVLRPVARRFDARLGGAAVFLASGLAHELAISLPARGGWGGPTLYFLFEAAGVAIEKSRIGRRVGLGAGVIGWSWTLFVAVAPLPLLFHAPFARNVIVPFYRALSALLP